MDASAYKDLAVSNGYNYHYYFSIAVEGKPYLFFLHGFPSTSKDWRFQVPFFKEQGYGIIVPDMLGYGGTSKPTDPKEYAASKVTKYLVEILDAEKVDKVVAIGHDWGAMYTSRLADYYPDRFIGFALYSVGYMAPAPPVKYEDLMAMTKNVFGYEGMGYWAFLSSPDAEEKILKNFDSFMSILFAEDPMLWIPHIGASGGLRAWVEGGQTTPVGKYLDDKTYNEQKEMLIASGLAAPLTYYKAAITNVHAEDGADLLAKGPPPVTKPVFFGATLKDCVAIAPFMKAGTAKSCTNLTTKDYDSGHWVMFECTDDLNNDLSAWLKGL